MSLHPTDYGHSETDKELEALLRRLEISYREARISLFEKVEKYMAQFAQEDAFKRALYDSGELSHEDYMAWRARKFAGTKQWQDMLDQLSDDMTHRNEIAASMINDTLPDVYALNHNYGTFEAEKGSGYDTTYTLYDKHTVARLLKGNPDLLPAPHVDIAKDKRWNQQQIQSALLQGLLQGESMSDIANRFYELTPSKTVDDIRNAYKMTADQIAKAIARKNAVAAMRNARTAVTGAENAGRIDSYKRADKMGIKMRQQWMATLDGRTRDSHAALDGETQEVGKKFSNGCRYPGDPQGAGSEIWNCRCSVVAIVAGADPYDPHLRESAYLKEQGLTYEDWKEKHGGHVERQEPEAKINFVPAKTRQEAEEFAKRFARNVDYSGISIENCNAINEKLNELTSKYPINELDTIGGKTRGRAIMRAWYGGIDINRKQIGPSLADEQKQFEALQESRRARIESMRSRYKNAIPKDIQRQIDILEKQLKYSRWSVYNPDRPIAATIAHEYGHILADQYFGQINGSRANPNFDKNYELRGYIKKWDDVFRKAKANGDIYSLSEYGATNAHEFFAESFAARDLGEKLPDYVSELMEEILHNGIM